MTIQNSPYCTKIRFPFSETELSKKLGELRINMEHLALIGTVIGIEPAELSVPEECDVSLDALNYLGERIEVTSNAPCSERSRQTPRPPRRCSKTKEADDTVAKPEKKSAQYQREILSIWAHTAFDRIVDSNQRYSAKMKKNIKEFFDFKTNTPEGVDLPAIINKTDPKIARHLNWLMNYNHDEVYRQFGLDFMYE